MLDYEIKIYVIKSLNIITINCISYFLYYIYLLEDIDSQK